MIRSGRFKLIAPFLVAAICLFAVPAAAQCRTDAAELRGDWGQARFAVEVADTAAERAQGLMYREYMATMSGMLFVYPSAQRVAFWMRDTYIPLDMIFMDDTGTVTKIHQNAQPMDERSIPGGDAVKFVLELNAGLSQRLGIEVGTQMRHPAIESARAAWPCN